MEKHGKTGWGGGAQGQNMIFHLIIWGESPPLFSKLTWIKLTSFQKLKINTLQVYGGPMGGFVCLHTFFEHNVGWMVMKYVWILEQNKKKSRLFPEFFWVLISMEVSLIYAHCFPCGQSGLGCPTNSKHQHI